MKTVLFSALLFALVSAAPAQDTAYSALRIVGHSQGKEALNHVLELRGRAGSPQPAVWKITLDEPRARGGVREIEVQRGKIISERTPAAARTAGSPMNFSQLNLDSDGAFTVANQEAQKAAAPFDHVDYLLRSGTGGGAPVWQIEVTDSKLGRAGSIDIAADTGTVLRQEMSRSAGQSARRPDDDRTYLDDRRTPPPPPRYDGRSDGDGRSGDGYSQSGESFRSLGDFFHRVGKRFEKRSGQLENFFTGKGAQADRERYRDDSRDRAREDYRDGR